MTTGNNTDANAARCSGWKPVTFSAKGDTIKTITEVRIHNYVGEQKKCW